MHLHGDRRIYTGSPDELICLCLKVSRQKVLDTILEIDANTVAQVRRKCKAGGGCGSCHEEIARLIMSRRFCTTLDFHNHIGDDEEDLHFHLAENTEDKVIESYIVEEIKNFLLQEINPYLAKFNVTAQVIESGEEIVLALNGADQEQKYTLGFWLDLRFHEKFSTITVIIA